MNLVEGVLEGKRRAVARLLTYVESDHPEASDILRELHPHMGKAHVIGITGSPGTGKSTLTDKLIQFYRRQGKTVGVIAVDPSSPFTGGAILGDRIRMQSVTNDPDVFIRSMGTRGALGGLSTYTADAVKVLDAAGKDVIIVETVGVGQAEVDIIRMADTVCVVLVPGYGDDVQAVKAGVMEIADVFVINKSDLDGADKVVGEVEAMMMLGHPDTDVFWWQPICRTTAERAIGVPELAEQIAAHAAWSQKHGQWTERRHRRLRTQVRDLLENDVSRFAFTRGDKPKPAFEKWFEEAEKGQLAPQDVAAKILEAYRA
ncbi:MAG: methylmalonyl Co-A mutase-associated GTPase MeaB [Thermoplasmatota archaeon]